MKVVMRKSKETKGTWQFKEENSGQVIGTLYVPKSTLEKLGDPEVIVITLEPKK